MEISEASEVDRMAKLISNNLPVKERKIIKHVIYLFVLEFLQIYYSFYQICEQKKLSFLIFEVFVARVLQLQHFQPICWKTKSTKT